MSTQSFPPSGHRSAVRRRPGARPPGRWRRPGRRPSPQSRPSPAGQATRQHVWCPCPRPRDVTGAASPSPRGSPVRWRRPPRRPPGSRRTAGRTPADLRRGQPRGPLVRGAAERDTGRELRDTQRHQDLPRSRGRPQPDPHRPRGAQHLVVGAEDADRHRDEGERDREHLEGAERPLQLLVITPVFDGTAAVRSALSGSLAPSATPGTSSLVGRSDRVGSGSAPPSVILATSHMACLPADAHHQPP